MSSGKRKKALERKRAAQERRVFWANRVGRLGFVPRAQRQRMLDYNRTRLKDFYAHLKKRVKTIEDSITRHDMENLLTTAGLNVSSARYSEKDGFRHSFLLLSQSEYLLRIVRDEIKVSRLGGKIPLRDYRCGQIAIGLRKFVERNRHFSSNPIEISFRTNINLFNAAQRIRINRLAIESLLTNLLTNSRRAVGREGKIIVEANLLPEAFVLSVNDNAVGGMPDEAASVLLGKIKPGFTTKLRDNVDHGKGLGSIKALTEKQHGNVQVRTNSDGSTISCIFPR